MQLMKPVKSKPKRITGVDQRAFIARLKDAVVEKDVEAAYKGIFQDYYGTTFPSPYGSDGYIEPSQASLLDDDLRLLLEVKFGHELTRPQDRAKLVAQTIYYLKKFENDGRPLPNVIVGGDENEMFTIYAPKLHIYLEKAYDWSIAPSNAWKENESLYRELLEDPNLNVFVFDVRSSAFDINEVFRSINVLSHQKEEFQKLRVTEANIRKVFDEFVRVVFGNENWMLGVKRIGAQDAVSIFIQSILGNPDVYIVPTKKNILHLAGGKEVAINASNYDAFFSRYDRKYNVREIDAITAIADQLIEEMKRRFHGDFWTPTVWADRAIKMMSEDLGGDWRERYVVWDPAAGTKNLTRDYHFKNLYSSTIHQSEIDMARQYNKEATTFQYDFLNDDIDVSPNSDPRTLKMPETLFKALKNNDPIVFYTNPPYGQATDQGETSKKDIANNAIAKLMRAEGLAHASTELYTEFIYRVQKLTRDFNLTNVFFFFFNKGFLASPAFEKFTNDLLDQYKFNDGFMLNAGEFQGTSSAWGIIFSNFQVKTNDTPRQSEFTFSVERSNGMDTEQITEHTLRSVSKKETISAWLGEIKTPKREYNDGRYPRLTGGFTASPGANPAGSYKEGAIGFLHNNGQNVQYSDKYVNLNSAMNYADHGSTVTRENFERICVTFAIRKSILPDASWINDKDVFRRPSEKFQTSSVWDEFVLDSIIYSLFHRSSYQTSLRQFEYRDKLYDVYNEWFFMGRDSIIALAERYDLPEIVYDARSSGERFVYQYLQNKHLSPEASKLLTCGRDLVNATFKKRFLTAQEHPEWQLMTWDAGHNQIVKMISMFKDEFTDQFEIFGTALTTLETKIRQRVYSDKILEK